MEDDPALRPSQPPDEAGQLRWLVRQNTNAMIGLTTEVSRLRAALTGGSLPGGRWGTAIVALVVWLAAFVGGVTALAWGTP